MSLLNYQSTEMWIDFFNAVNPGDELNKCEGCEGVFNTIIQNHCPRCSFWLGWFSRYMATVNDRYPVLGCLVIGHRFYYIADGIENHRGYMGKPFSIRLFGYSATIQTHDLWSAEFRYGGYQGDTNIPFDVENNAEFIGERPSF